MSGSRGDHRPPFLVDPLVLAHAIQTQGMTTLAKVDHGLGGLIGAAGLGGLAQQASQSWNMQLGQNYTLNNCAKQSQSFNAAQMQNR